MERGAPQREGLQKLEFRQCVKCFRFFPTLKFLSNFLLCGVTHPTPAPTFLCKESRQRYTKNLLVFGFPAEGGPPSIPPVVLEIFVIDEGERDRFAVTAGAKLPGDI